jgi:hypothetical protein
VKYERTLPARLDTAADSDDSNEAQEVMDAMDAVGAGAVPDQFYGPFTDYARQKTCNLNLFRNAIFASLLEWLLKRDNDVLLDYALRLVCSLWFRMPGPIDLSDPLLSFDLAECVFDCLHHCNPTIVYAALFSLANFASLSKEFAYYLLHKELIAFLTRYLHVSVRTHQREVGLRILQTLVRDGVGNALFHELKQTVPVIQLLLRTHLAKHAIVVLLPFLENRAGFEYARELVVHNELALCTRNLIDCRFGYFLFRAIYVFVANGHLRQFAAESVIVPIAAFMADTRKCDISSVFYVMAALAAKFWSRFMEYGWVQVSMQYADRSSFENRIAATLFLASVMLHAHDEWKDRIASEGGLMAICNSLSCFGTGEMELVCVVILQLFDLNFRLYGQMFMENVPSALSDEVVAANGDAAEQLEVIRQRLNESLMPE